MIKVDNFYKQIREKRLNFLIFSFIVIVFTSGITFTYVIPGLKGFEWPFFFNALLLYLVVANIFVGLFKERLRLVFTVCLLLSALGMGLRFILEWGEFSLVEHTNAYVLIGYPFIVAWIISLMYYLSSQFKYNNPND